MRIGFAGTPLFGATVLDALIGSQHQVVRVFTQPIRRAGRGGKLTPSPVYRLCQKASLDVHTLTKLRTELHLFQDLDALVVAAYGLILPSVVLDAPRHGCINVHASLLPRWRGATPIEHAILHGDSHTGVSIMQMTEGLDAGGVYRQAAYDLTSRCTQESVTLELANLGAQEITSFLDEFTNKPHPTAKEQDETLVTYAPKLGKDAERIDWTQPAVNIERQIRAFYGRGSAFTQLKQTNPPTRIAVLQATVAQGSEKPGRIVIRDKKELGIGCGEGLLLPQKVQLNRGKGQPLAIQDAMNGYRDIFSAGICLDS